MLGNNLKFILSEFNSRKFTDQIIHQDLPHFNKAVKLKFIQFQSNSKFEFIPRFKLINNSDNININNNLPLVAALQNLNYSLNQRIKTTQFKPDYNLSKNNRIILYDLLSNPLITFKPADKNLGLVLLDTINYNNEIYRQLSDKLTYKLVSQSEVETIKIELYSLIQIKANSIKIHNPQIAKFLQTKFTIDNCIIPEIYILPKIHKSPIVGRPIVPSQNWITAGASIVVDYFLQFIVKKFSINSSINYDFNFNQTIIKDSKTLINILDQIKIDDPNCYFITSDISSLYTNIPTSEGIEIISKILYNNSINEINSNIDISIIIYLLKLVLNNNYIYFNGEYYLQINGTAMGTPCAPPYANLYIYTLEQILIQKYKIYLYFYGRLLDDILIICKSSINIIEFNNSLKLLHPKNLLNLSIVISQTNCEFLDLVIFKGTRFNSNLKLLDYRVHQKTCNSYLYLPYKSYHNPHVKKAFIITELIRYIRNNNSIKNYIEIKYKFFQRLLVRGYPQKFLIDIFNSIKYSNRNKYLIPAIKNIINNNNTLFFCTEYNSITKQLKLNELLNIWKHKYNNLNLPQIIISYRSGNNLFKIATTNFRKKFYNNNNNSKSIKTDLIP